VAFKETLRKIRHRHQQPVFCPRCESSQIKQTPTFGILTGKYRCDACGYEGTIVLELEPVDSTEDQEAI
jgi:predicted RNA-binding Zn-ribbon protein involved in translation (DUF1610 family)